MTPSVAAALVAAKEPLQLIERTLPPPGPGEVTLKLQTCALGLSDWDVAMLDGLPRVPLVLGAEAVGQVVARGDGVTLELGQRVALTPLASTCGACPLCERGLEQYCAKVEVHGFHRDGALTTAGNFRAQHLVPLDDGLDALAVTAVLASGWSAVGGVQAAGVGAGQTVGVFGVGGVGCLAVQVAKLRGARVIAIEPDAARRAMALELGAEQALTPDELGPLRGKLHAALVCTPSTQAIVQAHRCLAATGTVVLLGGGPATRIDLPLFDTMSRGLTIRGAFLGSRSELLDLLQWVREGRLQARFTLARLVDAPARLYTLRDLGFTGRLIFEL